MTLSKTCFTALCTILFCLFVSRSAADEPYKLSDERIKIINSIIAKAVADKEDLTDPAVIQAIYDRIGAEMPLSPEEPIVQVDLDKLKKKARIRTLKKFKYTPAQMRSKFAAEAKTKYPMAQIRDKVTVVFKQGTASVTGTLYRINTSNILVNSTTVSFIDMDKMTRSRFDAACNREVRNQYVLSRMNDYRYELEYYQQQVLQTLQAEADAQPEKQGYIFLKRKKTWSTAKEIASARLAVEAVRYQKFKEEQERIRREREARELAAREAKEKEERIRQQREAAEQGDVQAQYNLAVMYAEGQNVEKDCAEAVKWFRKAAEQGHADAQYLLGSAYAYGRGVAKDETEAVKWYRKAAEQGIAEAQYRLGNAYAYGRGVAKDEFEAVKWFRKAAEQGHAEAQCDFAEAYLFGIVVPQDYSEAVKWFRKAAEQGVADAQYNLGVCYAKGDGVTQDYAEAIKWLRKAAEQGNEKAKEWLRGY